MSIQDSIEYNSKEFLNFCTLWMSLRAEDAKIETGGKQAGFLTVPWSAEGIYRELNMETLNQEQHAQFKDASRQAFSKWQEHYYAEKGVETFDFTIFPYQGIEGLNLYPYLINEQLGYNKQFSGKGTDAGYFTHFEDIPVNCPLLRHFATRMIQFNKTRTFGMKNSQRYNLWRKLKKFIIADNLSHIKCGIPIVEGDDDLYIDLDWMQLTPVQRYNVLMLAFKYAVHESTNMANHIKTVISNEIKFALSDIVDNQFSPFRPIYENEEYKLWIIYWDGPNNNILYKEVDGEFLVISNSKENENLSNIIPLGDADADIYIQAISDALNVYQKKAQRKAARESRYIFTSLPKRARRTQPIPQDSSEEYEEVPKINRKPTREDRQRIRHEKKELKTPNKIYNEKNINVDKGNTNIRIDTATPSKEFHSMDTPSRDPSDILATSADDTPPFDEATPYTQNIESEEEN